MDLLSENYKDTLTGSSQTMPDHANAPALSSLGKTAELALSILDHQPFGSMLVDKNRSIRFWNNWLGQWTGIAKDRAAGKTLDSLFPRLFQADFIAALDTAIEEQRTTEWSQKLDPERMDNIESIFTSSSREMPLHSVSFLPMALPDFGQCCLVQICESPFDPVILRQRVSQDENFDTFNKGELPVYLASDQQAVLLVDQMGRIQNANASADNLFGYSSGQLNGKPVRIILPDFINPLQQQTGSDASKKVTSRQIEEGVTINGEALALETLLFHAAKGACVGLLCRDISAETESSEALFQRDEMLNAVAEQVADGVIVIDRHGFIEQINPIGRELLAATDRTLDGVQLAEIISLENDRGEPIALPSVQALERGSAVSAPMHTHLQQGRAEPLSVMMTAVPVRNSANKVTGGIVVFRATSEARRVSSRLSWQARHDPLTQVANRAQLESELLRAIDRAHVDHTLHTLIYVDLYNFSVVNDTCGHGAGDELLRRFARILEELASPQDVVARIGNDEFAVLINDRTVEEARQFAEEILWQAKAFSFPWEERRLKIGVSIGAKVIDRETVSEIEVLLAAGASCSLAKESGRNRIDFNYRSKEVMQRQSLADWIPRITEALEEDRFVLYAQPIVPINDTSQVKYREVLIRMLDREGNIIPPAEFILAAERYGLIEDIDRWVFDKVMECLQEKQKAGDETSRYAINLSGNTVSDESLKDYFIARFRETGIDPKRLQFEVTETATIRHFDRAMGLINALKDEGCLFALDDFGSGLSSLGYLKQLPVDYLKIDGSFIRAMELSDVDYSMVSTINHLGQIMGIKTIAECVETEGQLALLKKIGVDYVQGYIYGKPKRLE